MTNDEIRIAVAEACGWLYVGSDSTTPWYLSPQDAPLAKMTPRPFNEINARRSQLPNFPNDLNACAQFIKTLAWGGEATRFNEELLLVFVRRRPRDRTKDSASTCYLWGAEPVELCEAFLRVKGLWKEKTL